MPEKQRLHVHHARSLKYHIPAMSVVRTVAVRKQISKEFALLSRDACTGTQSDPTQRDNQGVGSKKELGKG
jgi:hypothetical protein